MKKISTTLLAVVAVLCSVNLVWSAGEKKPGGRSQAQSQSQSQSQPEYSADSYTETEKMTIQEKVYSASGKIRKEQDIGGGLQISIIRMDKGVMWMLMPEEKMYMEMGIKQAQAQNPGVDVSAYQMEKTEVGKETVNGHEATKYKVMMTGADGTKLGGYQWIVNPGIQIKMDAISKDETSKERIKIELKNLTIARQDPALFEIPKDYTKMGMPDVSGMGKEGMKGLMEGLPQGFSR